MGPGLAPTSSPYVYDRKKLTDRDNPGVIAPPPLIYLGFVAAGYIVDSFWAVRYSGIIGQSFLGMALVSAGFLLSGWSVLEFVRHGTHPDPRRPTTRIVTAGPFRFSRNPIYLAFALMHAGIAIWSTRMWILVGLLPAVYLIHLGVVRREERYLERKFGDEYVRYRRSVRRWL